MDTAVPLGSRGYWILLALLVFSRGMDFLSTWVGTPNLELEGNPVAKKLGWKWGLPLNGVIVFLVALWPVPAIVLSTTSVLVAARNFQHAWLMRSLGEHAYREWFVERVRETRPQVFLFCLAGNTLLTAAVGLTLIFLDGPRVITAAIGMGIVAYAVVVAFYSLLALIRNRRNLNRKS
jgi:hypothetical protein